MTIETGSLKSSQRSKDYFLFLAALWAVIFLSWLVYWGIFSMNFGSEAAARHGDMFGGLNTLFAGFAFAALIVTIWMQAEELALQRREMSQMVDAQTESQRALHEQVKLMARAASLQAASNLLAAYTTKMEHYQSKIDRFGTLSPAIPDPNRIMAEKYQQLRDTCLLHIEKTYKSISEDVPGPPVLKVVAIPDGDPTDPRTLFLDVKATNETSFGLTLTRAVLIPENGKPEMTFYGTFGSEVHLDRDQTHRWRFPLPTNRIKRIYFVDGLKRRHQVRQDEISLINKLIDDLSNPTSPEDDTS